jgi:glycerophosphoryl diester phosphodiesterase
MRTRHRMFPPRDGAPAHVPSREGVGPGVPAKSRWWGADFAGWGGGVVLPRQAKRSERPIVIAHRGAHGGAVAENSLAAISRALEVGADGVEFDVCGLRDGTLVVAHGDSVVRDGAEVPLEELSSADLEPELRSGALNRVEAALELVRGTEALVCVDWKGVRPEPAIGRLVESYGLVETTIMCSAEPAVVADVKRTHPAMAAGLSIGGSPLSLDRARTIGQAIAARVRACGADAAMVEHRLASSGVVGALREEGRGVFLWTAVDRPSFETSWRLSPDGIMSDALVEHRLIAKRLAEPESAGADRR